MPGSGAPVLCAALLSVAAARHPHAAAAAEPPANRLSECPELREFLNCRLAPRLGNAWDYVSKPGALPRVEWDRPEVVEKVMGTCPVRVRWFDGEGREVVRADRPGPYGFYAEAITPGGQTIRRGVVLDETFGSYNWGELTRDTPTEMASLTKLVTGVLFAQFVGQGLIGIDDPVGKYFPDFPATGENVMTLRHCFTHATALEGHEEWGGMHNPWLENVIADAGAHLLPGRVHDYNGMGYDLAGKALDEAESQHRKTELDRMAAMLSRLGGRGYQVREGTVTYGQCEAEVDPDPDSDSDLDEEKRQPPAGGDGKPASQP